MDLSRRLDVMNFLKFFFPIKFWKQEGSSGGNKEWHCWCIHVDKNRKKERQMKKFQRLTTHNLFNTSCSIDHKSTDKFKNYSIIWLICYCFVRFIVIIKSFHLSFYLSTSSFSFTYRVFTDVFVCKFHYTFIYFLHVQHLHSCVLCLWWVINLGWKRPKINKIWILKLLVLCILGDLCGIFVWRLINPICNF